MVLNEDNVNEVGKERMPPGARPGTGICMECDWVCVIAEHVEELSALHSRDTDHATVCRPIGGRGRINKKKVENIVNTL